MVRQLSSQTKLLIVDDDAELCAMLKQFFGEAGFVVDSELTGDRGTARAETGGYDLMILDVTLPGLNGLGVLRRIRRESSLPVLMLTAKAERNDRIAGFDLGADDYLTKPFFPEELLARVRRHTTEVRWCFRQDDGTPSNRGPLFVSWRSLRSFSRQTARSHRDGIRDSSATHAIPRTRGLSRFSKPLPVRPPANTF